MLSVKLTDNKDKITAALEQQATKALETCGLLGEGYAKTNCPVDTGALRNSISHNVTGHDCYIGTNMEYAAYVEFGTGSYYPGGSPIRGMRAQPYLKPAIDDHRDTYQQVIKDALKS